MQLTEPTAGELDRRVEIRRRTDLPYLDSEVRPDLTDQRKRWAKIEPVGAATYAASVQTEAKVTHRVYLRHIDGITIDNEVVHGTTVYRVRRSMSMNGAKRFTMLEVEELGDGQ